ncbi:MAG: hypothetical protein QXV35_07080 [Archaeoglobaceae archaeon]
MKEIRIIFNTGEVDEQGKPILSPRTYRVEDSVTAVQAEQIVSAIESLTEWQVQEAYLITTTQVV